MFLTESFVFAQHPFAFLTELSLNKECNTENNKVISMLVFLLFHFSFSRLTATWVAYLKKFEYGVKPRSGLLKGLLCGEIAGRI